MIIKIDVDGVIRDIITPMCELYNNEVKKQNGSNKSSIWFNKNPTLIKYYDVEKEFLGATALGIKDLKKWFFEEHSEELFLQSKPFEGVEEAMEELRRMGHKIIIVTYQKTFENKIHTLQFLKKHGIEYDDICFTCNKERIRGDILIDDNPDFLDMQNDSTIRVLMKRSYNNGFNRCHIKIDNLSDIVNILNCINEKVFFLNKNIK